MKFNAPHHKVIMVIKYDRHSLFSPFQSITMHDSLMVPNTTMLQALPHCVCLGILHQSFGSLNFSPGMFQSFAVAISINCQSIPLRALILLLYKWQSGRKLSSMGHCWTEEQIIDSLGFGFRETWFFFQLHQPLESYTDNPPICLSIPILTI